MRTMNLDPFWRTSIGFDRLFDLMDESLRFEPEDHYPPCNIVRTGENTLPYLPRRCRVQARAGQCDGQSKPAYRFPLLRTTSKIKVSTFIAASPAAHSSDALISPTT